MGSCRQGPSLPISVWTVHTHLAFPAHGLHFRMSPVARGRPGCRSCCPLQLCITARHPGLPDRSPGTVGGWVMAHSPLQAHFRGGATREGTRVVAQGSPGGQYSSLTQKWWPGQGPGCEGAPSP